VYQLHGVDLHGKTVWKRRLRRSLWLQALMDKAEPGRVKNVEQQDIQATHRVRTELKEQRTAKAIQIRGLVAE
jgi:hypothetical protein